MSMLLLAGFAWLWVSRHKHALTLPWVPLQELMTRMFLVNIPLVFAAVWRVLQMFVDDRVKAKIRFLRKADLGTLHEFIDRDLLPENLGGKFSGRVLSDKTGVV